MTKSESNKLKRALLRIRKDVQGLLISRFIFKEVQKIIAANPRIQIGSSFYAWMGYTYSVHALIGIRRSVDKDTRSLSLLQLLEAVEKHNESFTLSGFQRMYPKDLRSSEAPDVFARFSGKHMNHLNPAVVRKDIRTLRKSVKRIKSFTDKRIAHLDKSRLKAIPTFNHLDGALDELENLVTKYILLFLGEQSDLVPIWQYDWKEVFKYPWIQENEQ